MKTNNTVREIFDAFEQIIREHPKYESVMKDALLIVAAFVQINQDLKDALPKKTVSEFNVPFVQDVLNVR